VRHSAFPNSGVVTQTLQAVHHHRKQLLMRGAGLINQVVTELGVAHPSRFCEGWATTTLNGAIGPFH